MSSTKGRTKFRLFQKRMLKENFGLRKEVKNVLKLQNASNFYTFLDNIGWSKHEVSDGRLWKIL